MELPRLPVMAAFALHAADLAMCSDLSAEGQAISGRRATFLCRYVGDLRAISRCFCSHIILQ